MASELLRPGNKGNQQQAPEQGLFSSLGTGLAQIGTGALGGAANILQVPHLIKKGLNYAAGNKQFPENELPTTQDIRKSLGVSEPQGFIPETLIRISEDLPLIAATGGMSELPLLFKSLGQSGAAALGSQSAKEAGLGPWGELLGGLGGLWGTKKGLSFLNRIHSGWNGEKVAKETGKGVRSFLENAEKEAYKKSEELYKGVQTPYSPLNSSLNHIYKDTLRGDQTPAKKEIQRFLTDFENRAVKGDIPIQDVIDWKKDASKFGFTRNAEESPYFKRIGKAMDDYIKQEGKIKPEAFKAYNQGNAIHSSLKSGEKIKEAIEGLKEGKFTSSNFFRGIMGIGKKIIPAEQAKFFVSRPEARKYYFQAFQGASKDNPVLMLNSLKKLAKEAGLYEQQKEKEPKSELLRAGTMHNK